MLYLPLLSQLAETMKCELMYWQKKVVDIVNETYRASIPSVEDIQDLVEKVLIEEGHAKTAKAYILYRKKREEIRGSQKSIHGCRGNGRRVCKPG